MIFKYVVQDDWLLKIGFRVSHTSGFNIETLTEQKWFSFSKDFKEYSKETRFTEVLAG